MLDASVYIVIGLFAGLVIWGLLAFAFLAITSAKRMNGPGKISINCADPSAIPRPQPVERGCGGL